MVATSDSETAVGSFSGQHAFAEIEGVSAELLNNLELLHCLLETAMKDAGATVLNVISEKFEPQGVTVLALLSESHASLHTYPEVGSAFIDVFTCGNRADPMRAIQYLTNRLEAKTVNTKMIRRGRPCPDPR